MSTLDNILPPAIPKQTGTHHPINQTKDYLLSLLTKKGFTKIDGPEIETEEFNFDMLNIKKSHPARQMHDTFYVNKKKSVLRTHTSPVQIRSMLDNRPPMAYTSSGKVYRKDDDATHLPMFHQVEGIYVDTKKFSGLAFGLGVERIAMLKYEVNDIRDFYKSNLDFLTQFK